jgi:nucleoside 2-deoxyribosyltransferase
MNITNNQTIKGVKGIGQVGNNNFTINPEVEIKNKVCFLVSPIGDKRSEQRQETDNLFDTLNLILKNCNLDVQCSHKLNTSTSITKEIMEFLEKSDLVIINLTGLNPNVMYEFGYRCAIKKPFICVAKEGTKLPFDTQDIRTIFYSEKTIVTDLKDGLLKTIQNIHLSDLSTPKDKSDNEKKNGKKEIEQSTKDIESSVRCEIKNAIKEYEEQVKRKEYIKKRFIQ